VTGDAVSRPGSTIPRFADGLGPRTVIPAVWDVLSAAAAKASGATHLFLSGAAVNNVRGYPDRGLLDIDDIARVVKEIVTAVELPLLVDAETGFGHLARLARLLDELIRAGAAGVMLEDQDETGQSKRLTSPGLSDPELMCRRIELTRAIAGDTLGVLARTDYLPTMDFAESMSRLSMYDEAGCDWLIPVFAPSIDSLTEAAARFPGRLMVLPASPPISGVMRYSPSPDDIKAIDPVGVLVTGQYRNAYQALRHAYSLTLASDWPTLFAERPEPVRFEDELGLARLGMTR
jgi:2-methylisocitrate lyase-like PEP mutase family enzyme